MHRPRYRNRAEAGQAVLAALQSAGRADADSLVVGLARGGLPVAAEVARGLGAELDVAVVRKLGAPGHEELALGAITRDRMVLNDALVRSLRISPDTIDSVVAAERRELRRRETAYRGGRGPAAMRDRVVILVDDGIATGASMRAVALDARDQGAARVIIAVPTAPADVVEDFRDVADDFVCPHTPSPFLAVGLSYEHFDQTSDDEVRALLS
jgi:predicted phosphoribosyltransferase